MADEKNKRTLNIVDKYYIDGNPTMKISDLSRILKIEVESIKKYKDSKSRESVAQVKPTKGAFARKGGAIVMTQAQSEMGDDYAKSFRPKVDTKHIFQPFGPANENEIEE